MAKKRLNQLVQQASDGLHKHIRPPSLGFGLKGKTAGTANPNENHIELNPVLLAENIGAVLNETLPHELAHLITARLYGEEASPHGHQWQRIMRDVLGVEPSRCHTLDVGRARTGDEAYLYNCGCPAKEHQLSVRCHAVAQKPGKAYFCKKCRAPLTFAKSVDLKAQRAKAPTLAQVAYACLLAEKAGMELPSEVKQDRQACRRFVEAHDPKATPVAPADPRPASDKTGLLPPTDKQLALAAKLAKAQGEELPATALQSRDSLSQWISARILSRGISTRTG